MGVFSLAKLFIKRYSDSVNKDVHLVPVVSIYWLIAQFYFVNSVTAFCIETCRE